MNAVRITCPGCGATLSSGQAFTPGAMMDCPRCRLLFVPTTDDVTNPRGRADEIAAERAWAEADVPGPHPSPSPYVDRRRRYRWMTDNEFGLVLIACVVMLVLGGVVVGIYALTLAGVRMGGGVPVTAATTPPPAAADPTSLPGSPAAPPPPLATEVEIEDPLPPPKRPLPQIDEDPPTPPAAPRPAAGRTAERLAGSWEPDAKVPQLPAGPQVVVVDFQAGGQLHIQLNLNGKTADATGTWSIVSENAGSARLRMTLSPPAGSHGPSTIAEFAVTFLGDDQVRLVTTDKLAMADVLRRRK